jgi:hypothetical protein
MEAYLWACYLWAYESTKYELFLERAKTAIRMTMEQHTDGWKWTNGLAQERARMILPLAWLVRVEDTPEHRAWLRTVMDGLLKLQQPNGAIREELGLLKNGVYPPPRSNAAGGKAEAPLIQENGDPVIDLLYTSNFALLGLHEAAAATGEKEYIEAAEKLVQFLCRIQIRSESHPALDGGWFRAFDYQRWEFWASNSDKGWGAWAIESGWTQGWIVSVLGMRQLDTSLWDLVTKTDINNDFDRLRREMLPDEVVQSFKPRKVQHGAVGKTIILTRMPSSKYATVVERTRPSSALFTRPCEKSRHPTSGASCGREARLVVCRRKENSKGDPPQRSTKSRIYKTGQTLPDLVVEQFQKML